MSALLNTQHNSPMLEMNNNSLGTVVSPAAATTMLPSGKDSRWLTLEVCREFQRSKCSRTDQECKFAHPPPHVEVQNGRVTCCFDSIKGKCQRKDPPCKYLHPPQHLKEQLVQNGRNNLILKQLQTQAIFNGGVVPTAGLYPNTQAVMYDTGAAKPLSYATPTLVQGHPYAGMMTPQYIIPSSMYPGLLQAVHYGGGGSLMHPGSESLNGVQSMAQMGNLLTPAPSAVMANSGQTKVPARPESHGNAESSFTSASMAGDAVSTSSQSAGGYPAVYSLPQQSMPPMAFIKRQAVADKTGMPVYPMGAPAMYPQGLMAHNPNSMQLNPHFIPVTLAGQPAQLQHYQGAI